MIPDLKWLVDALKLPFKVIAAVALSAIALLVLDLSGLLNLGPLAVFARTMLIVLLVVSGALVVVEGIAYLVAPSNEKQRQSALACPLTPSRSRKGSPCATCRWTTACQA